jgi:hypothetical protein
MYALIFNMNAFVCILGGAGAVLLAISKKVSTNLKIVSTTLLAPLAFNVLALYLGFSVLFIQGISGDTWFNVRYGIMMAPSIAIFVGFLIGQLKSFRPFLIGILFLVLTISILNGDAATIDDARVGSSQKNVTEVAGWLHENAGPQQGFILISAASHDAIIFSSGLPMSRFIHEGTGLYWTNAVKYPDRWARYIIMRTNDLSDLTFKMIHKDSGLQKYKLVHSYPFADIYELKPQYLKNLEVKPVFKNNNNK